MTPPDMDTCRRCSKFVPVKAWFGNLFLTFYKLGVGFLGGSPALMADGLHSFTDVIGTSVILMSTRVSERPPDRDFPYGQGKVEFMSSMFIYIVLMALAVIIFTGGLTILMDGHEKPPHYITLFGGLVSVLYNVLMYRVGVCAGTRTNSPAVLANAFENRADAISSIAVAIGILAAITIHPAADPLAAMVVGVIIFVNCITEGKKAFAGLMDRALSPEVLAKIRRIAEKQTGVTGVRYIKSRATGHGYWVDLGIEVGSGTGVTHADSIAADVRDKLLGRSKHFAAVEVFVLPQTAEA